MEFFLIGVADTSEYYNKHSESGIVEENYFNVDCTKNEICFVDPQADYTFEIASYAADNMSCSVDPLSSGDSCENDKYLMRSAANLQTIERSNLSCVNELNPNGDSSSYFELALSEGSSGSFHSLTLEEKNSSIVPDESEDAIEVLARSINQSIDLEKPLTTEFDDSLEMLDTGFLNKTVTDGQDIDDTKDDKIPDKSFALLKKEAADIEKMLTIGYDESPETSMAQLVLETTYVDQPSVIVPDALPELSVAPLMNRSIDVEIPRITDYNESIKITNSSSLNQATVAEQDVLPEILNALALQRTINVENSLITKFNESAASLNQSMRVGRTVDYNESLENADVPLLNQTISVEHFGDTECEKVSEISDTPLRNHIINAENLILPIAENYELHPKADASSLNQTIHFAKLVTPEDVNVTELSDALLSNPMINVDNNIIAEEDESHEKAAASFINQTISDGDISITTRCNDLAEKLYAIDLNKTININKHVIREVDEVDETSAELLGNQVISAEKCIPPEKIESSEKSDARFMNQTLTAENVSVTTYNDSPEKSDTTDLNQTITVDTPIGINDIKVAEFTDELIGDETINVENNIIPEMETPGKRGASFMNHTLPVENVSVFPCNDSPEKADSTDLNQTITMDKPLIIDCGKVAQLSDGHGSQTINVEKGLISEKESLGERDAPIMNPTLRAQNISVSTFNGSPEKSDSTSLDQTITMDKPIIIDDGIVVELADGLGNQTINDAKGLIPEMKEPSGERSKEISETLFGSEIKNVGRSLIIETGEDSQKPSAPLINQTIGVQGCLVNTYKGTPDKASETSNIIRRTQNVNNRIITENDESTKRSAAPLIMAKIDAEKLEIPEDHKLSNASPQRKSLVVENSANIKCNTSSETADKKTDAPLLHQTINVIKGIINEQEASSKIAGVPIRFEVVYKEVNDLLLGNQYASQISSKYIVEQLGKKLNELSNQTDMLITDADKIRKHIAQADQNILVNVLGVEVIVAKLKKYQ